MFNSWGEYTWRGRAALGTEHVDLLQSEKYSLTITDGDMSEKVQDWSRKLRETKLDDHAQEDLVRRIGYTYNSKTIQALEHIDLGRRATLEERSSSRR